MWSPHSLCVQRMKRIYFQHSVSCRLCYRNEKQLRPKLDFEEWWTDKKRLTRISLGRPGKTFWLDWACQWAERGERARLELLQAGLVSADVSATPSRSSDSGRRSVNCVTTTPHHAQAPPGQRRPTVTQCSDWLSAADGSLVSKL